MQEEEEEDEERKCVVPDFHHTSNFQISFRNVDHQMGTK